MQPFDLPSDFSLLSVCVRLFLFLFFVTDFLLLILNTVQSRTKIVYKKLLKYKLKSKFTLNLS